MNRKRFHRTNTLTSVTEINIAPLIDIAFSLLIIFMITAPLLSQSIDLELPKESQRASTTPKELFHTISIDRGLKLYFDNQPTHLQNLNDQLASISQNAPSSVISVQADASVPYQRVIDVIDLLKTHHLQNLSLETQGK